MLEAEFQNKAVLLEEEDAEGVQGNKEDNTLAQLGQQSVPTSNRLPEDKLPNHLLEDPPLHHLLEDKPPNQQLENQPLSDILEVRPLSNILDSGPPSDLLQDRLPQPEHGQVTSEPSTTRKEGHQPKEDLEETVRRLLEEKKQNTEEIEQLKRQIQKLTEEVKDERLERKSLAVKLQKSQRKFLKLNRVSLAVTQEYAEMMGELELEQDLRLEAEIMAHQMLKEKRAISRQSMILMQNLEPSEMLIKALEDVRTLSKTLEETKAELQTQVKSLELQLAERPSQEEFMVIKGELNTANLQKNQLEEELKVARAICEDLQEKVKTLEEKLKENELLVNAQDNVEMVAEPVPPPPPPPPPPLPVCPSSKAPSDPLALVRERRGLRTPAAEVMTVSPDVKEKAIQEMKQRIEQGAILRPTPKTGQRECAANKRKSVISELQGVLLNTARKPLRRMSRRRISRKAIDNELSCFLKKRRQIVDHDPPADKTDEISKQTQEQTAETKRQTQEEGGSQAPEVVSPLQNNPVLLKLKQRTSPVESRRSSQVQWQ
ncbi:shootin-1-like isoform X2 [Lithobates pipiens]